MEQINKVDKYAEYGNRGIEIYSQWLKRVSQKKDEEHSYELFSAVDKFSVYDLLQVKRNNDDYSVDDVQYIELKLREVRITDYDDCSIDNEKILKLQRLSQVSGHKVFIVAIYEKDRKIAVWELDAENEIETRETTAKWHTAEDWGRKTKIMAMFRLKDAHIYSY